MTSYSLPSFVRPHAFINGEWISSTQSFPVLNPATATKICDVSDVTNDEIERTILCAHSAQKIWANMLVSDRAKILNKWRDLILEYKETLAELMTMEQGKPLVEARAEIGNADAVRWSVEESYRVYGKIIPDMRADVHAEITHEPVGVVAAITPWNFPHSMVTRKVSPALAAGCAVILKPAEDTPLSALALASLAHQAGVPSGVFNVVPCSRARVADVGKILTTHERIRKVSFTGSTQVGKIIMANSAGTVKNISLELGGNAPFIIFESADLDRAVDGVMTSKFRNAGQTCICANRVYVADKIYDQVVAKLKDKIKNMVVGDGRDVRTTLGPLINDKAFEKVGALLNDARDKGAAISEPCPTSFNNNGYFKAPVLVESVLPNMRIADEEIFGPLLALYRFHDENQVIAAANDTQFGLAAYFYTQDPFQARRVGQKLEYGMIGCNTAMIVDSGLPFGGRKESGIGREGGPDSLYEFMETKYIVSQFATNA
jgi:succinate-semialdehyde dehydrogenase/glutarate-semialdehyde dehydrogenase